MHACGLFRYQICCVLLPPGGDMNEVATQLSLQARAAAGVPDVLGRVPVSVSVPASGTVSSSVLFSVSVTVSVCICTVGRKGLRK